MSALLGLTWLAGTWLPLGALWLVYRGALRGERCFGYNRLLLLLAPAVAGLWPLLPHPALSFWPAASTSAPSATVPTVLLPALNVAGGVGKTDGVVYDWLLAIYAVGVVLGFARLAYQCWQVPRAARQMPREERLGYTLVYTGGQLPTSSFGRTVFWDDTANLALPEATTILAHELAHVRQGHTYDLLWLEAWRAVLWVNPFAHALLPALRLTHELLADRAATQASPAATSLATSTYTALLARLAARRLVGSSYSSLLQSFTFSFTLTRIAMLQNQNPTRRWKQWLILPVLGGLFVAACLSASNQPAPSVAQAPTAATTEEMAPPPPPPPRLLTTPQSAADSRLFTYVEQMPQLPDGGGTAAIIKQIQEKISYPAGTQQQGRVFASFTVRADGSVGDTKIVKSLGPSFDAAVLRAINQLPRFVPGKQSGRAVAVSITVPVLFSQATPN